MSRGVPSKDPNNIEPYFFIWCDKKTGINDGSAEDDGELQGATVSTIVSVTVSCQDEATPTLLVNSSNKNAVTIKEVAYAVNTVVTAWLTGGTDGFTYKVLCRITTSDSRTLDMSMLIPVVEN